MAHEKVVKHTMENNAGGPEKLAVSALSSSGSGTGHFEY